MEGERLTFCEELHLWRTERIFTRNIDVNLEDTASIRCVVRATRYQNETEKTINRTYTNHMTWIIRILFDGDATELVVSGILNEVG